MSSASSPLTTRSSLVEWTSRFVQPPGEHYLGPDDAFIIDLATSFVPSIVRLAARILTPEGEIHYQEHELETVTTRQLVRQIFRAREGFLMGLAVSLLQGSGATEWNWASVGLTRSATGGGDPYHGLAQNYFDLGSPLFWPGQRYRVPSEGPGFFRQAVEADPIAGVNISIVVPENARWRPVALEAELVTDATVANRRFILEAQRTGVTLFRTAADVVQTASLTFRYVAGHWGESGANRDGVILVNWPDHAFLSHNESDALVSSVANLQGGDNFGAPAIYVEEWFERG